MAVKPLLTIRADASAGVGAGHVMRCLTLAESWLELGGRAECWGHVDLPFARGRANRLGVAVVNEQSEGDSLLLVDVYDEAERVSLARAATARRKVLVDDLAGRVPTGYSAVWNPNAYGSVIHYSDFPGEVIAGRDSIPIRRGLPQWLGDRKAFGSVSFGGGDVPESLRSALAVLPRRLDTPHGWGVGALVPPGWTRANETEMWADLHRAGFLITAAGSTVWEAAAVGIPVALVVFADNQALVGDWGRDCGVPVIDVRGCTDSLSLAEDLAAAARSARKLPHLQSGAELVARRLLALEA